VGVVADVHTLALDEAPALTIYEPLSQGQSFGFANVAVRGRVDPASLTNEVRGAVDSLDPDLPVFNIATMQDRLDKAVSPSRFHALLLGIFSSLALVLAAVGIYGVIAYSVSQRTHEIGVRMALGAHAADVLRMVIFEGASLTVAGVAAGLLGAFALTRLMKRFLFEVSATDPLTFGAVAGLIIGVALIACYIPARKATKVDPMIALRHE
jgi:putative ABC transport system permease protein